ncbi:MAG: T9SS type A sorting domain-containing protein [Flavobacteriales bacterium]
MGTVQHGEKRKSLDLAPATTTRRTAMKYPLTLLVFLIARLSTAQTLLTGTPDVTGSGVYAIEKAGNTMYIGGFFSMVDGLPRAGIARFDATTGALDSWAPTGITNGVTSLTRVANKLIAGGSFVTVNGQSRMGICMFDLPSGNLNAWSDMANFVSWRQGVGAYGNNFYYCTFSPSRIVAVDATTGTATPWQSSPEFSEQGDINAIHVSGSHVYVGGDFTFDTGASVYDNLCRFDLATGELDSTWHPEPQTGSFAGISAIVRTNDHIFIGGNFDVISGQSRKGVAAYDLNGALAPFNQNSSSYEVLSLFPDGDKIWVGGNSYLLGGQSRYRIAQIKISTSAATCWDASTTSNTWSTVQALYVAGDTVYAGPFGSPQLAVFTGGPLPQTPSAITGPASVSGGQVAAYSVPLVTGYTYSWSMTGGSGASTTNSINVTWGAGPSGAVNVVVNNPGGGANCSSDTVSLPVAIGNTGINDTAADEDALSIFPNPTTGLVTLRHPGSTIGSKMDVRVMDALGNVVLTSVLKATESQLDLSHLPSGFYCVLTGTDGEVLVGRVVRE